MILNILSYDNECLIFWLDGCILLLIALLADLSAAIGKLVLSMVVLFFLFKNFGEFVVANVMLYIII